MYEPDSGNSLQKNSFLLSKSDLLQKFSLLRVHNITVSDRIYFTNSGM